MGIVCRRKSFDIHVKGAFYGPFRFSLQERMHLVDTFLFQIQSKEKVSHV